MKTIRKTAIPAVLALFVALPGLSFAAEEKISTVVAVKGKAVIERGTHEELAAGVGLYAAFAAEQSAKTELDAIDVDPPSSGERGAEDREKSA